jgi:hypothetical protein
MSIEDDRFVEAVRKFRMGETEASKPSALTAPCYCADEAEDLIKRIDGFIEYAEATRKFADMGFYKLVKAKMISMNALLKGDENVRV